MSRDDDLLQEHVVRRARLVTAVAVGRRRSWAARRSLVGPALGGVVLAVVAAVGFGVATVVRSQLRANEEQQRNRATNGAAVASSIYAPASGGPA